MEAAREEEYFYKLEREQVKKMRLDLEHKLEAKKESNQPLTEEEELTLKHLRELASINKGNRP
ncbi:unnamed protein product [Gongylonema pulchrum]|uniref:BMERB domain-containing protein n=1 Tax=Gongylonema pulchrum TaxID=637853 RepID=A0A183EXP3_9BILA|nr:unnamed protein product [Gongylonema pulchrum]VDN44593.1 unnamed protein product [Gongylonema pulchrum]